MLFNSNFFFQASYESSSTFWKPFDFKRTFKLNDSGDVIICDYWVTVPSSDSLEYDYLSGDDASLINASCYEWVRKSSACWASLIYFSILELIKYYKLLYNIL